MQEEKWIMNDEEIDREVESLCRWAAGRAGVIVVAPVLGQIALAANEVYLIKRIANLYGKDFDYCEPYIHDFNHELGEQNSQRI